MADLRRHASLLSLLAAAAATLSACGSPAAPPAPRPRAHSSAEREWVANAYRFLDLVQSDLTLASAGGSNVAVARKALGNASDIYSTLVAYTYFSGCDGELESVGEPSLRAQGVVRTLHSACGRLERASTLFHLAVTNDRPALLLRATRTSQSVQPLLDRADVQLVALLGPAR